ncbi:MAG: hypothetical protein WCU74_04730 [Candidatus Omnitrophota bacterium]|jgi:type II secretory pathway pseudopilin PulG
MSQRGFTTIELMIVVMISTFIGMSLFVILRAGEIQTQTAEVRMQLQDSAREGLYKMLQEIRESAPDRIAALPQGGASLTFNIPDPANPLNADFSVNWGVSDQIRYALGGLNNRQLIRTNLSTNTQTVLANNVTQLTFAVNRQLNPTLISVTMRVQRTLENGRLVPATPLVMTGEAEIRNRVTT